MVSAEVLVALGLAPRDAERGDHRAGINSCPHAPAAARGCGDRARRRRRTSCRAARSAGHARSHCSRKRARCSSNGIAERLKQRRSPRDAARAPKPRPSVNLRDSLRSISAVSAILPSRRGGELIIDLEVRDRSCHPSVVADVSARAFDRNGTGRCQRQPGAVLVRGQKFAADDAASGCRCCPIRRRTDAARAGHRDAVSRATPGSPSSRALISSAADADR